MAERYIIMAGTAGAAAALRYSETMEEELKKRYSKAFLRGRDVLLREEKALAMTSTEFDCLYCERFGDKGLFGKLWEMSRELGTGLKVMLDYIQTDQYAVEIMEMLDKNVYEEAVGNGMLIVTENVSLIVGLFMEKNVRCCVIGALTNDKACVVESEFSKRYLTPER